MDCLKLSVFSDVMLQLSFEWIALLFTWLVVIPFLVLRPPKLLGMRRRWMSFRHDKLLRSVKVDKRWIRPSGKCVVPKGKCTVVVFVNSKSGGGGGKTILLKLRSLPLDPMQIVDLSQEDPVDAIQRFEVASSNTSRPGIRLIACGGDGTVGWVLEAATKLGRNHPVSIVPLGTGNDLSRSLGWGSGFSAAEAEAELSRIIVQTIRAQSTPLDRWKIVIENKKDGATRVLTMNNYFSIGIDAEIGLKFHLERNAFPERFTSQSKNMLRYAWMGFEGVFEGHPLGEGVRVKCNGRMVEVNTEWKGLVISNIPCYQGGSNFWGEADGDAFAQCSMMDGAVEVMGLSGALHIGLVHLAVDQALRLAQGDSVELSLDEEVAAQVDGEPWMQPPCTIRFSLLGQHPMLVGPDT